MRLIQGLQLNELTLQNIYNVHELSLLAQGAGSWKEQKHYFLKMVLELATPVKFWALWFLSQKRLAKLINELVEACGLTRKQPDEDAPGPNSIKTLVAYLAARSDMTQSQFMKEMLVDDVELFALEVSKRQMEFARDMVNGSNPSEEFVRDLNQSMREIDGKIATLKYSQNKKRDTTEMAKFADQYTEEKKGRIVELPGIEHPFRKLQG